MKTSLLLINLGTPDSPKTADIRKFLREFLNDKHVIDLPWVGRKLLLNLIILPFRSPKTAALYKKIWTTSGSPLLFNTKIVRDSLRKKLADNYLVEMAMRYGEPSLKNILKQLKKQQVERIIIFPLYPQYASSTSGSIFEMVLKDIAKWKQVPELRMIHHFHDNPGFIEAFVYRIKQYNPENYDHVIMSYHGLPLNQVYETHEDSNCEAIGCSDKRVAKNFYCYLASCYETSRLIAKKLNLPKQNYTVSFQSRLNKNWTAPFTDEIVKKQSILGNKRLLVISPAFITDCLETIYELGEELKADFEKTDGNQLTLVESLNDLPLWIKTMAKMIKEETII